VATPNGCSCAASSSGSCDRLPEAAVREVILDALAPRIGRIAELDAALSAA